MNRILVTGGSGFIGSQIVKSLANYGHEIFVVDRKINPWTYTYVSSDHIHQGDFLEAFSIPNFEFDTVIHLAGDILVEQGEFDPSKYYSNNVMKLKEMLDILVSRNVKNIIFSSSGSVYGNQQNNSLTEDLLYNPQCTYASTKVAGELLIKDYSRAHELNYVIFRYFNACGADPDTEFGYIQYPATHIIPILCNKINKNQPIVIYGNTYPTYDGTCVRDYVHIQDIANAHQKALEYLNNGNRSEIFNIGGIAGELTVKQLAENAYMILNRYPNIQYASMRSGDVPRLVADTNKARNILGWEPKYSIGEILDHAWNWEVRYHG